MKHIKELNVINESVVTEARAPKTKEELTLALDDAYSKLNKYNTKYYEISKAPGGGSWSSNSKEGKQALKYKKMANDQQSNIWKWTDKLRNLGFEYNTNESTYTHILKMDQFLNESKSDFQVYHNQYSSAIDEVEKYANKMGYDLDTEEYGNAYVDGFFKPNDGQTKKDTLTLYKNGKEQKKAIHVQIYGMGDKFEINMYIN